MSCGSAQPPSAARCGLARRHVDPRDGLGGRGDLRRGGDRERGQLLEMRGLRRQRMPAGLDHAARFLVQLGRVEAHDAGQRLAMGEAAVGRHQPVGVPRRDLDMIAEHRVVADLERAIAGRSRYRASSAAIARRPFDAASRNSSSAAS